MIRIDGRMEMVGERRSSCLRRLVVLLVLVLLIAPLAAQTGYQNIKIDGNLVFPQVAVGGGYQMMVVLMNLSSTLRASGTLHLFRQDGTPLEVLYTGGRGSDIPVQVDAGATAYLPLLSITPDLSVGWALLELQAQHPLLYGSVIYARVDQSMVISQVGVAGSRYQLGNFMRIMAPATMNTTVGGGNPMDTGIAIVNTGPETMHIDMNLVDSGGKTVATSGIDLASGHQIARFISEIFSQYFTGGTINSFQGLLKIETTKEGMVALALLMSGDIMTSVPVVPLPRSGLPTSGL